MKNREHKSIKGSPAGAVPAADQTFQNDGRRSHVSIKKSNPGKGPMRGERLSIRKKYNSLEKGM